MINNLNISQLLKILGYLVWLLLIVLLSYYYYQLPTEVPIHYDTEGKVDKNGDKSTLFILPIIAIIINVLLIKLSRYPQYLNYPIRITDENKKTQYKLGSLFILVINIGLQCTFLIEMYDSIQISMNNKDQLSLIFLIFSILVIVLPLIIFIYFSLKNK